MMGLILSVTVTDDMVNPDARQVLMSSDLATSMEPGMLVREVWGLLAAVTDASPNLGFGPDISAVQDGQRELEPPPPLIDEEGQPVE